MLLFKFKYLYLFLFTKVFDMFLLHRKKVKRLDGEIVMMIFTKFIIGLGWQVTRAPMTDNIMEKGCLPASSISSRISSWMPGACLALFYSHFQCQPAFTLITFSALFIDLIFTSIFSHFQENSTFFTWKTAELTKKKNDDVLGKLTSLNGYFEKI